MIRVAALITLAGVLGAADLAAQIRSREDRRPVRERPRPAVALTAGPSSYRLSGNGTGFAAGLRFEVPSGRRLIVEPGIGYFRYRTETNASISYLLPEISFQLQAASRGFRPYLGIGAGLAEFATGPGGSQGTVHAAAGFRVTLASRLGLRAEARLRSHDPLNRARGRTLDLGFGGSWTLGY